MREVIFEIDGTEYPHRYECCILTNKQCDYGMIFSLLGIGEGKYELADEAYGYTVRRDQGWPSHNDGDSGAMLRLLVLLEQRYPVRITIGGVPLGIRPELKLENVLLI